MPRPIRARSTWHRPAMAARRTWRGGAGRGWGAGGRAPAPPPAPGAADYLATGTLRALAVTSAARAELLPQLPPVGDFVPGYETTQWYGMGAPAEEPGGNGRHANRGTNSAPQHRRTS